MRASCTVNNLSIYYWQTFREDENEREKKENFREGLEMLNVTRIFFFLYPMPMLMLMVRFVTVKITQTTGDEVSKAAASFTDISDVFMIGN